LHGGLEGFIIENTKYLNGCGAWYPVVTDPALSLGAGQADPQKLLPISNVL